MTDFGLRCNGSRRFELVLRGSKNLGTVAGGQKLVDILDIKNIYMSLYLHDLFKCRCCVFPRSPFTCSYSFLSTSQPP